MENELSELNDLLECNERFREHIKDFIEVFVQYYGEEQRKFIERRFNSVLYVGYIPESEFKYTINKIEVLESQKMYKDIIDKTNLDVTEEQLFGGNIGDSIYSLGYYRLHCINSYREYYKEFLLGEDGRNQKYYKNSYDILHSVFNDITFEDYMMVAKTKEIPLKYQDRTEKFKEFFLDYVDISSEQRRYEREKQEAVKFLKSIGQDVTIEDLEEKTPQFTDLNETVKDYEEALKQFESVKNKYSKYYEIIDYNENLKSQLERKYYTQFLESVIDEIPERDKENVLGYINKSKGIYLNDEVRKLYGYDLETSCLLNYFSKEMNEKLNNENTRDWEKDTIKTNRIKYFNIMGIDLGQDYESYVEKKDIWVSEQKIEDILKIRSQLKDKFNREYYNNMIPQKHIIEEIKDRGFLEIDANESAKMYKGGTSYMSPNIIKNGGDYQLTAKVVINFGSLNDGIIDHIIVHELNHLYELSLNDVKDNWYEAVCGWDIIDGQMQSPDVVEDINLNIAKRRYELFNEIINEKISKEISKMMFEKGIGILGEPTEKNYEVSTGYDSTNYIVGDFFETYKEEILASRRDNNMQVIFDTVGKENFEELNNLFNIHNEHFAGMKYYALCDDLINNRDTENTRIYKKIMQKRNDILKKMQEQYKNNMVSKEKDEWQLGQRPTVRDFKSEIKSKRIAEGVRRVSIRDLENDKMHENEKNSI